MSRIGYTHRIPSRRGFVLLEGEELGKFIAHADRLEVEQRDRFRVAPDNYNFFESAFEQEIRDEIADRREFIKRQLETKAEIEKHNDCCCSNSED